MHSPACGPNADRQGVCGAQVRTFEHMTCLKGLQALALTRANQLDLQPLLELKSLQALCLAGLQSVHSLDRGPESSNTPSKPVFAQLSQLKCLRCGAQACCVEVA